MSIPPRFNTATTLWVLTAVIGFGLAGNGVIPSVGRLIILPQVAFALFHGARRYGWRAIWVFVAAGLLISNFLENLAIEVGFPFGNYHYTGGGKLFDVPWFIGPAYLATGYLAWIVATVLLGDVRRNSPWLTTIGTPVVAAFAMTVWDLSLDPRAATISQTWIWEHGGGYFGVPMGNFLGWTFTVYLFMQVFALYLRSRGPLPVAEPRETTTSDLQAVLLYLLTTVSFFTRLFTGEHTTVTDASGTTWQTADIYETSALVTVYGMCFIALLALLRIAQRHTPAPAPTPPAETPEPTEREKVRPSA
ncbi:carotenoid biosynthesis protein [Streptomyces sp. NPDC005808]|uniref:carotenoid biosynthesis protein n=1 Tax=Streptomyces sp. NPDC005808 TaxID=3364734 RepID=UPI00367A1A0C